MECRRPGPRIAASDLRFEQTASLDFQDQEGAVVGQRRALREPLDVAQDEIGELGRGVLRVLGDGLAEPARAIELPVRTGGLSQAVRIKHEDIAGIQSDAPLVVGDVVVDAQRKPLQLDFVAAAAFPEQRLRLPSVGDAQLPPALLPGGKAEGHEAALDAALAGKLVHLAQHLGRLKLLLEETSQDADGDGPIESSGSSLSADVAQSHAELLRAIAQEVVEVAADFARGEVASGDVEAIVVGRNRPQQGGLDALGGLQVALHAGLVAGHVLVEAGVFERNGQVRGENGKGLDVLLGEVVELRALQVQDADDAALVHHGNGELGTRLGVDLDVARVCGHIGHQHGLAQGGRCADDALGGGDAQLALNLLAVFEVNAMAEGMLRFVIQQNAEDLIINHALDQLGGATEKLLDRKDGTGFAADLIQDKKRFGLRAGALKQAGIFNGHGEARGQQAENVLLVAGEINEMAALDVQDADALAFEHQRDGQLRAHGVNGIDVSRVFGDIANADRMADGGGRAGDPLPDGDAQGFGELRRVPNGKAVLERAGEFIHEQDAEDLVVNQALDERGRPGQDLVQIKRGVDLLADFGKRAEHFGGKVELGVSFDGIHGSHFIIAGVFYPPSQWAWGQAFSYGLSLISLVISRPRG